MTCTTAEERTPGSLSALFRANSGEQTLRDFQTLGRSQDVDCSPIVYTVRAERAGGDDAVAQHGLCAPLSGVLSQIVQSQWLCQLIAGYAAAVSKSTRINHHHLGFLEPDLW